ncbi:MAG: HEPN domain-containing protein [Chloroflexota bacterium]
MAADMSAAAWIPIMTDRIVKQFDPLQVILFGSFARGDAQPHSDVDLLVVMRHVEDKLRIQSQIASALLDVPVGKDVIVTTPPEIQRRGDLIGTILRPALREGKVLFQQANPPLVNAVSDSEKREEAQRWLRYAADDLRFAEMAMRDTDTPPRYVCFLSQQSAEKALKAILIVEYVEFPRTHNVEELLALVPQGWQAAMSDLPDLGALSSWAVQARYPDSLREATVGEARAALKQARAVWQAVSAEFSIRGLSA